MSIEEIPAGRLFTEPRGLRSLPDLRMHRSPRDVNTELVPPPDPRASLDRGLRVVWRWRLRFCLVFGIGCIAGILLVLLTPTHYTARATVLVGFRQPELATADQIGRARQSEPDIDGATELMMSPALLKRVVDQLKLADRPDFHGLLDKDGFGASAALRVRLANWFARLVPSLSTGILSPIVSPEAVIGDHLSKNIKIGRIGRSPLLSVTYSARDPVLAAGVVNAVARGSEADEFLDRIPLAERTGFEIVQTSLVSPAAVPYEPSAPNIQLICGATLVIATSVALTVVLLSEYLARQTVLSADEVSRFGVRALGLIPASRRKLQLGAVVAAVTGSPGEAFAEAITSLQIALYQLILRKPPSCLVLLFTSALPCEGKSTTVVALATSMASTGARVLVIDADLRSPSLHRAFSEHFDRRPSSSNVDLDGLIQRHPDTGVSLLSTGAYPRPLEILGSTRFGQALANWRLSYDFILIDTPPVIPVGDARALAPMADYVVFVVRWGKTGWNTVNEALRILTESGARIAGVALAQVDLRRFPRYYDVTGRYRPIYQRLPRTSVEETHT